MKKIFVMLTALLAVSLSAVSRKRQKQPFVCKWQLPLRRLRHRADIPEGCQRSHAS
jgi:hypothetical protein